MLKNYIMRKLGLHSISLFSFFQRFIPFEFNFYTYASFEFSFEWLHSMHRFPLLMTLVVHYAQSSTYHLYFEMCLCNSFFYRIPLEIRNSKCLFCMNMTTVTKIMLNRIANSGLRTRNHYSNHIQTYPYDIIFFLFNNNDMLLLFVPIIFYHTKSRTVLKKQYVVFILYTAAVAFNKYFDCKS